MGLRVSCAATAVAGALLLQWEPVLAQDSIEAFYKGRAIDMVIGTEPGGGYDAYARLISRHMGRYIAGNPTIIPKNMPGAGSNKAAGFLYSVAAKDGSVLGAIQAGAIVEPLLGDKSKALFEPTQFLYLGNPNREVSVCVARADARVKKFEDLRTNELLIGATAAGGTTRDMPNILNRVLGTRFKVISGYPGTKDIALAIERGEVQGVCGTFMSTAVQYADWFNKEKMTILVQEARQGHPMLDKLGVPLSLTFTKTDEERQALELVYDQFDFGRPFVIPPGVPADRVAALRAAFDASMKDATLLAEAEKARLAIDPVSGADVQRRVVTMFDASPAIVALVKQAMTGVK